MCPDSDVPDQYRADDFSVPDNGLAVHTLYRVCADDLLATFIPAVGVARRHQIHARDLERSRSPRALVNLFTFTKNRVHHDPDLFESRGDEPDELAVILRALADGVDVLHVRLHVFVHQDADVDLDARSLGGPRIRGDAGADYDHIRVEFLAILEAHALDFAVAQNLFGIRLNFYADAYFFDLVPEHPAGRGVQLLVHQVSGTVQYRYLGVVRRETIRRLQPEQAAPDHYGLIRLVFEHVLHVPHRTEHEHAFLVPALYRRHGRGGTDSKDQTVVGNPVVLAAPHFLRFGIHFLDAHAATEVYVSLLVPLVGAHPDVVQADDPGHVLREPYTVVGTGLLFVVERDLHPVPTFVEQAVYQRRPGVSVANHYYL